MIISSSVSAILAGLASAFSWGVSDLSGGIATRRSNVFGVVIVSELVGGPLLALMAVLSGEHLPPLADLEWAALAGVTGSLGVAALYQSMARGQIGLAAPIAAVVGAGVPVIAGAFLEGLPGPLKLVGFAIGLAGLWLISQPETLEGSRVGVRLAILAGLGFAGFFIFIHQASAQALVWPLVFSRSAATLVMLCLWLVRRERLLPGRDALPATLLAGLTDVGGTVFYSIAAHTGRMDVAAVLSSISPMFTIFTAMIFVGERIQRWQAAGISLLMVAIVLFALPEAKLP
jgi:drug/metabolite transporter (DMT)-like permease